MKKSELLKMAQFAVLKDYSIEPQDKLDLLDILSGEKYVAELLEKKGAVNNGKF